MNRVIENVLHLHRREQPSPQRLEPTLLEILAAPAQGLYIKGLGFYLSAVPGESMPSRLDFKARQESGCCCMTFAHGRNPR